MFAALQPWLRQRMLEAMRMRKIAQLENHRSSRVILLVHRQETMRLFDINDSEEVLRAIQMTDDEVLLDIVLQLQAASSSPRCRLRGRSMNTKPRSACSCRIMQCRAAR
jgi:hypothetical protein